MFVQPCFQSKIAEALEGLAPGPVPQVTTRLQPRYLSSICYCFDLWFVAEPLILWCGPWREMLIVIAVSRSLGEN